MSDMESTYIHLGKIAAAHGLQGHLLWIHDLIQKKELSNIKVFFIEMSPDNSVPFFIDTIDNKDATSSYVKTEEVNSRDAALKLVGKKVWLKDLDFQKLIPKNAPAHLVGYKVYDRNTFIGIVNYITEMPHQILLAVQWKEKEVLLPVHEATLKTVDRVKKEIYLILPEGLLEVYI